MPPLDPAGYPVTLSADATQRGIQSAVAALPWPLSWLVDRLQGDRLAAVKAASTVNPMAPVPSRTQLELAQVQGRRSAVRAGFSGLAGSSSSWDNDQGGRPHGPRGATIGPIYQDVTSAVLPPSRMLTWAQQGHPMDANMGDGYNGPVITPGSPLAKWGLSTRFPFPRIISGTLLPPGARTPTAREMVKANQLANPGQNRIDDPYLTPDEGWF
jgi:hypothetical protein